MKGQEHIDQAELLLRESQQDLATARDMSDLMRVLAMVMQANAHATLAVAKKRVL